MVLIENSEIQSVSVIVSFGYATEGCKGCFGD